VVGEGEGEGKGKVVPVKYHTMKVHQLLCKHHTMNIHGRMELAET